MSIIALQGVKISYFMIQSILKKVILSLKVKINKYGNSWSFYEKASLNAKLIHPFNLDDNFCT